MLARNQPGVSGSLSLLPALAQKVVNSSAGMGNGPGEAGCICWVAASVENVRLHFLGMVTIEKSTEMSY